MDSLADFLPPVARWFRESLGEPTEAQRRGWPAIKRGENTLILAPTGSGKTLAAFLVCLDSLWRQPSPRRAVQVLYVSPLKALNNDIHRNLQLPLEGVAAAARSLGHELPTIEVALRTGDTPPAERQRLLRRPPHVLITTPESLHLLLTSGARETLRSLTHCIIDEIHSLCPNKRGVFLSLLLERLEALNPQGFVRIGLSATQRPLEDVARYLGGQAFSPDGRLVPRPVTIVDAGIRKELDLRVLMPVEEFGPLPEKSIWPSVYRLLADEIGRHRSTIVFANNRRTVERITSHLNAEKEIAHAHHGSVSLEVRQATEQALKEGRLPAVVATASLELGIDMGAVDLVCQVVSPGNVARGLQRVGRAGHIVGRKSKGRLIAIMPSDLIEQAVLAREMAAGRVEALRMPGNCLDVLAQQIVALVGMDDWDVSGLFAQVRQSYAFRDLSPQAFETVLEMISGRYRWDGPGGGGALSALQPRVSWDRAHNRLLALPGSKHMALVNGGTIPNTGQYAAYTGGGVRIGELDEEFIYERRVGDTFLLGTNAWRLEDVQADRVIVTPATGAPAMVPFWRGEQAGRSFDLGLAIGSFLREAGRRIDDPDLLSWLEKEFYVDPAGARNIRSHIQKQLGIDGALPTDRTIPIEAFRDQLGDWQVALLSPFGQRLHLSLRLAIEARLRQRLGYIPQCLHHDDGLLFRFTECDKPVLDLLEGLTPDNVEDLVLGELADSALFALRFRQNAARALLLPRMRPGKRAPLWLQRIRGRDLLQVARGQPDFPIVAETFRECLHDHLDLPRLKQWLLEIHEGKIKVAPRWAERPSPFASGLTFAFTMDFMYEYDEVEPEPRRRPVLDQDLLEQLTAPGLHEHLLDPRAIQHVERRLRGLGKPPRSVTEMAEWLRRLGDLTAEELHGPMAEFMQALEADGRAVRIELGGTPVPERWVLAEEAPLYRQPLGRASEAAATILKRFLETHALVGLEDVLLRYPFDRAWAQHMLDDWTRSGRLVALNADRDLSAMRWAAPGNLQQVGRGSLALKRSEVITRPPAEFADFVLRWQHHHPDTLCDNRLGLADVLDCLEGLPLAAESWEQFVFPARMAEYQPGFLDERIAGGEWTWLCRGDATDLTLAFWRRESVADLSAPPGSDEDFDPDGKRVLDFLRQRGASFVVDLAAGTSLTPTMVRESLWSLVRKGLVTNDQFDVVRQGSGRTDANVTNGTPQRRLSLRRRATERPEGRWALVPWAQVDDESLALGQVERLLRRYGIVCRELALLDPWMVSWRSLYDVLSRLELTGEVRRGYFVEGLSGAQFALPLAACKLQDLEALSRPDQPLVLVHSQDPANLYGTGAPFDVPLLEGGKRPFIRRSGNWLILRGGRPVLLIEQQGRKLTALDSASRPEMREAVGLIPTILQKDQGIKSRNRLIVEEWNDQPVMNTEGQELLEAAGFVRDYQGMALYKKG